ncbi:MAG: excinuclease ABC subunit UvrC [Opitutales bacterium]|nr:excinuclease ABC subunit UvrC [Opitutales bacterium]
MPNDEAANLKEKVRRLPQGPGVYLMKDRLGKIIYVGKAKNLRKRVSTYFQWSGRRFAHPKIRSLVSMIHDLEVMEVRSETEALLLEGKLIKHWKPRYNSDFTDDKRFLLVRVDTENPIPKFRLCRFRKTDQSKYFGPFAHAGPLRKTLAELRRRFGVLLSDGQPKEIEPGKYRLYDDVRAELYGHENVVTKDDYHQRVNQACEFLEGKAREWLEEMREEMKRAAEAQNFEKAAQLRDALLALKKTTAKTRRFLRDPVVAGDSRGILEELQSALELPTLPRRIECFDISHISGTFTVASMVHFFDGKPAKSQYRRYRIKSFVGNDDFRAMEEVVGRRYRRLHAEEKPFPDLIVIDGGKGQVYASLEAFAVLDLPPPPLVGLAKREETIILPDERESLTLPSHSGALRLLQRLRDEAHRFANTFSAELRQQKIRESILDDFPRLGEQKKQNLLKKFGGIRNLKKATAEDLQAVEGIGPKTAQALFDFLHPET